MGMAILKQLLHWSKEKARQPESGMTMLELLVVVIMVGILATTLGGSWVSFTNRQRISRLNNAVQRAIEEAQLEAKRKGISYSASFRINNTPSDANYQKAEVAVLNADKTPTKKDWRLLGEGLDIKAGQFLLCTNISDTNANQRGASTFCKPSDLASRRTITFDSAGVIAPDPDFDEDNPLTITVATPEGDYSAGDPTEDRRCVRLRTLLGSITTGTGSTECPTS